MKILIVSDTHGIHDSLEEAVAVEKPFDLMIHLGDGMGYQDYFHKLTGTPVEIVAGNNDFFLTDLPMEKILHLGGMRIFMTHGHQYYVYYGTDKLVDAAIKKKCDIVMFGHTHLPVIEKKKGILVINPGSLSYPRQPGHKPSYIVMEKRLGEAPEFEIKYLERREKKR